MPYTPIIGTLGFVISPDKQKVLLVHRSARQDDHHYGKYNGLGGKLERNEDVLTGMRREIHEEAGIECHDMVLRGTVNWTDFGPNGEDWLGFIFRIDSFSGTAKTECPEGKLDWVRIYQMSELPMWEGDRHFLPLVFDDDPRIFHGHMPYDNQKSRGWSYERV